MLQNESPRIFPVRSTKFMPLYQRANTRSSWKQGEEMSDTKCSVQCDAYVDLIRDNALLKSKLDALVKAAEALAPKCWLCGNPAHMYDVDDDGCRNHFCAKCVTFDIFTDAKAQALWTAIQNAKEPS
jgi:hypothetical protein